MSTHVNAFKKEAEESLQKALDALQNAQSSVSSLVAKLEENETETQPTPNQQDNAVVKDERKDLGSPAEAPASEVRRDNDPSTFIQGAGNDADATKKEQEPKDHKKK